MRGDTKKPEYLALFPYGKIPAFKGTDGFTLTESKAISRYSTYLCLYDRPGSTHHAWICRSPCTSSRSLPLAGPPQLHAFI